MDFNPRVLAVACVTVSACCALAVSAATADETLELSLVAEGFDRPVFATAPPGENDRLFVVEQYDDNAVGRIRIVQHGDVLPQPFLEIGPVAPFNSTGVLCMAFAPDYDTSGHFFVFYTDAAGDVVISRFTVSANPNVADAASEQVVVTIPQPHHFHQGGWLGFGPDGYLYISAGDGGPGNDPDQRGQDVTSLLGKMLRLDVNGDDFPANPFRNYSIPAGNPFIGEPPLDEIWSLGVREVWRASFDRLTGDFFMADVGEDGWEEIDFEPSGFSGGANYGWRCEEGDVEFEPDPECVTATFTSPIHQYDHTDGRCAIIGGYVYRGANLGAMAGKYFFADHCTSEIWSFRFDGVTISDLVAHDVLVIGGGALEQITSFGEDANGELLITTRPGQVFRVGYVPDCHGPCGCPWDINGNGAVDIVDLLALLSAWGPCADPCTEDVNGDLQVDIVDLLEVLSNWG